MNRRFLGLFTDLPEFSQYADEAAIQFLNRWVFANERGAYKPAGDPRYVYGAKAKADLHLIGFRI